MSARDVHDFLVTRRARITPDQRSPFNRGEPLFLDSERDSGNGTALVGRHCRSLSQRALPERRSAVVSSSSEDKSEEQS